MLPGFTERFSKNNLLVLLFFGFLSLPFARGDSLTPIHLLLDWYPQTEHGGYFCALVNGYYKEAGLDVQITPLNPSAPKGGPQVAIGKYDFSLSSSNDLMIARKQGFPLISVMATMQHDPQCIMVHDDSPIHTFADLEGHTISVPPGAVGLQYAVKKYHLTNVQEQRLNVSTAVFIADPNFIQQAFVTAEPYFVGLQGVKSRCLLYSDAGMDPYRILFTSESFLQNNPDLVKKFVAASIKGWNNYLTDPIAADEAIKKANPASSQGQIDYSRNVLITQHFINNPDKGEVTGQMTAARWSAEKKVLVDIGILPADFDETAAYTLAALPKSPEAAPAAK